MLGGVECRFPNGRELQLSGTGLYISPVAPDVQDVDEWQGRHSFDALFQRFFATLHRQGRTVFLPGVADQAGAEISNVIARRLRGENREPTFILGDAEWALVEAFGYGRAAEVIALP